MFVGLVVLFVFFSFFGEEILRVFFVGFFFGLFFWLLVGFGFSFFLKGECSDFRDDHSEPKLPVNISFCPERTGLNLSLTQAKYHQKGFLPLIKKRNQQRLSVICEILPFCSEIAWLICFPSFSSL